MPAQVCADCGAMTCECLPRVTRRDPESNEREMYDRRTGLTVGWIIEGRRMTSGSRRWTEWGFEPATAGQPIAGPFRHIGEAYEAARASVTR